MSQSPSARSERSTAPRPPSRAGRTVVPSRLAAAAIALALCGGVRPARAAGPAEAQAVIRDGFDRDTVYRVVKLTDRNEYKRRQAAVGPRVSRRAFGKDRRYPITNGWRPGD